MAAPLLFIQSLIFDRSISRDVITVRATPAIDGVENQLDHIFDNPLEFISNIIYKWIDKHS